MAKGRRYENEPKLNMKKVFAVLIAIAVVIMFVFIIQKILAKGVDKGKITGQSYYTMFKDNKWGVINSNGDVVIDPSYAEMIVIPDNKKDVFICTYDVDYDNGTYKTKVLNSKNEEIFNNYSKIEAIQNSDISNNLWYESNVLRNEKDGKYGYIDKEGTVVVDYIYDDAKEQNSCGFAAVKKDGKWGSIDSKGNVVADPIYDLDNYLEIDFIGRLHLGQDRNLNYYVQ